MSVCQETICCLASRDGFDYNEEKRREAARVYKLLLVEDDPGIAVALLAMASGVRRVSDWLCKRIEK